MYNIAVMSHSLGAHLLRQWRSLEGLSQFAAGQLVQVDPVQLGKFERGQHKPSRKTAVKIQQIAHIPVDAWDLPAPASAGEAA